MVLLNYAAKEVNAKVVYYGPGLSGKTTNLQHIHDNVPSDHRGKMVSLATEKDRTLFFDLLPLNVGKIGGFKTRIQLYTVPGQVHYNSTRKLVLTGVDAVVFVADSQLKRLDSNITSMENLKENLIDHGLSLDRIPWIIQYNKRDLENIMSIEDLDEILNPHQVPYFPSCAITGDGIFQTLRFISKLVLKHLSENPSFSNSFARSGAKLKLEAHDPKKSTKEDYPNIEAAIRNKKLSQYSLSEFSEDFFPNSSQQKEAVFMEIPLSQNKSTGTDSFSLSPGKQYTEKELENIKLYNEDEEADNPKQSDSSSDSDSSLLRKIEIETSEIPDLDDIPLPNQFMDKKRDVPEQSKKNRSVEKKKIQPSSNAPRQPIPRSDSELKIEEEDSDLPDFLRFSVEEPEEPEEEFPEELRAQAVSEFIINLEKFYLNSNSIIQASSALQTISLGIRANGDQLLDLMEDMLNLSHKDQLDQLDQALSEGILKLAKYNLNWQDLLYVANEIQTYAIDRKITERLDKFQVRFDAEGGQIFYVRSDDEDTP
ncbi:MAG: hypothetical protein B6244_01070 [Candidatus Cloacimonetes bacterium 4572_55]|nr:MAG: hypothetical protein B6244_01070 [Candidatus Cloacimonetes bacterium 4572_55]